MAKLLNDSGLRNINAHIVKRMRAKFGTQILQAVNERDSDLAKEMYLEAYDLPQTSTEAYLKETFGYELNGMFHSNPHLIVCYKKCKTFILKILDKRELSRAEAFFKDIRADVESKTYCKYITSFDLVPAVSQKRERMAMIMPAQPTILETMPMEDPDDYVTLITQVCAALEYIHVKGYVYMDMKPSNVCFDAEGNVVLIDLGSVAKIGDNSQCTSVYLPFDLQNSDGSNTYRASVAIDWWMFLVTIAEKKGMITIGTVRNTPHRKALSELFEENKLNVCNVHIEALLNEFVDDTVV